MRFYLDTSVIGALFDVEMPQRIEITRSLLGFPLIEIVSPEEVVGYGE